MKTELKKLHRFKSYCQIKINTEIRAIFLCILAQNFNPLGCSDLSKIFVGSSLVVTECRVINYGGGD